MAAMTPSSWLRHLQMLLPRGLAWPRSPLALLTRFLDACAQELARANADADLIIEESDPRTTFHLLPRYEYCFGLPEACSAVAPSTLAERRAALVAKYTDKGGLSRPRFIELAERLGYTVTIDRFRPFITGRSRCGDRLNGAPTIRFHWRVNVPTARATLFRTGTSQCGDRLGKFTRAEDLECLLERLKPAHTTVHVSYHGV